MWELPGGDQRIVLLLRDVTHWLDPDAGAVRADLTPLPDSTRVESHRGDRVRSAHTGLLDHASHRFVAALSQKFRELGYLAAEDGTQSGSASGTDVACANRQSEDLALDSDRLVAREVKRRCDEHAER